LENHARGQKLFDGKQAVLKSKQSK